MRKTAVAAIALTLCAGVSPVHAELSASIMALAKQCAPSVAPKTMAFLVSAESSNNPFAINVNGGHKLPKVPKDRKEAAEVIGWLEEKGYNFDVGYGQVNSANFAGLGVTAESLLDGCNNLDASAKVLTACYSQALKTATEPQRALRHALSCYNTGSQTAGFTNGYVGRVLAQAGPIKVPALRTDMGESQDVLEGDPVADGDAKAPPAKPRSGAADGFDQPAPDGFVQSAPDGFDAVAEQKMQGTTDESLSDPAEANRGTQ